MMNKIMNLEIQVSKIQEQTGHNAARLTVIENERNSMYSNVTAAGALAQSGRIQRSDGTKSLTAGNVPRRATPYLTGEEQLRLAWGESLNEDSEGFPTLSGEKPLLNTCTSDPQNHSVGATVAVPPASSRRPASVATTESNGGHQSNTVPKTNQWVVQRQEHRKRIREATKASNVIEGSQSHSCLECGYQARSIFVFNVNKKYKDSDIKAYMEDGGVIALKIREISHKEATNKSFKVVIKQKDLDSVMESAFWAEGIKCREWIN